MKNQKITQKQLFGLLDNLNHIKTNSPHIYIDIINNINDITILEKKWIYWNYRNNSPEYFPLDLTDSKIWITYEKCRDFKFYIEEGKLICDVVVWDGDYNGMKDTQRFSAKLLLPDSFIFNLYGLIEYKFNSYLEEKYEEYLETMKIKWMEDTKKNFIQLFN